MFVLSKFLYLIKKKRYLVIFALNVDSIIDYDTFVNNVFISPTAHIT